MDQVRDGIASMPFGRPDAGEEGATPWGWRAPQRPQKESAVPTWFPHWLQKGICNFDTSFGSGEFPNGSPEC